MKILLVADYELRELWDCWDAVGSKRTEGVELILSAGDIKPEYLEFLVTVLNVPCLYVRGNHDGMYDDKPPLGCVDIDGRVCEVSGIRIAGLGGSMRYHPGKDMYTEREMAKRVRRLRRQMRLGIVTGADGRTRISRERGTQGKAGVTGSGLTRGEGRSAAGRPADIFLTHAPCLGHGDLSDLPHTGFACFNKLLEDFRPAYHCYGHVHMEYGGIERRSEHPSGTQLINVSGMYILEV